MGVGWSCHHSIDLTIAGYSGGTCSHSDTSVVTTMAIATMVLSEMRRLERRRVRLAFTAELVDHADELLA